MLKAGNNKISLFSTYLDELSRFSSVLKSQNLISFTEFVQQVSSALAFVMKNFTPIKDWIER